MHKAVSATAEIRPSRRLSRLPTWLPRRWASPIGAMVLVLVADQITKWQIREWLGSDHSTGEWYIAGSWLGFDYVENTGAAFGTLTGLSNWLTVGALLTVVVLTVFYARLRNPSVLIQLALGAVVGGAFGNIVDRVALGYVVDFVAVGPWPRFNVADSAVTVGILLLLWKLSKAETDAS